MNTPSAAPGTSLKPLALAWLALVSLTLASPLIGNTFDQKILLQVVVALIIWTKGTLVARCFLEADHVHPFIRNVLRAFVAYAPVMLVLMALFGESLARLTGS